MPYGMLFVIAVVLLLGWLHSSRKEAARQDVDRRIVPAVLDAVFQEVQFAPNGRITCFGEAGLPLPQYDRMTGGEHVRAKYRGYEVDQMIPSRTTVRLGIFLFFGSRRFGKIKINKHFRVCDLDAIYKGINDPAVIILGTFIGRDKELLQ